MHTLNPSLQNAQNSATPVASSLVFAVRHGEQAKDPGTGKKLPGLSSKGEDQARAMGRLLRERGVFSPVLFATPAERTQVTARLIAEELGMAEPEIVVVPELDPSQINVEEFVAAQANATASMKAAGRDFLTTEDWSEYLAQFAGDYAGALMSVLRNLQPSQCGVLVGHGPMLEAPAQQYRDDVRCTQEADAIAYRIEQFENPGRWQIKFDEFILNPTRV